MYECIICTYVSASMLCNALRGQKQVLDSLELELQTLVSCHVNAGILT